jgi:hypothetical protein
MVTIPGDILSKLKSPHNISNIILSVDLLVSSRNSVVHFNISSNCFCIAVSEPVEQEVKIYLHVVVIKHDISEIDTIYVKLYEAIL